MSTARETNSKVVFDKNTYNLRYDYKDQQGILHHVEFTDAVTNFNTLRFAAEYGLGGTALWRLGSEDNRLWSFYKRDVSKKECRISILINFNMSPVAPMLIIWGRRDSGCGFAPGYRTYKTSCR